MNLMSQNPFNFLLSIQFQLSFYIFFSIAKNTSFSCFFFGHLSPHSSRASLHFFFISIRFSLGWVWLSSAVRSSSQRYSVCRRRRWWVMPCDVLLRVRCAVFRIWSMRVRQYATNLTGAKRDVHFLSIYIICTAGYDSIRRTSIGWATRIRLYLQRIWKSDHYAIHGRGRLVVMSYFVARTRMGPANKDDDDDDDRRTRAKKWSVICRFFVVFFFFLLVGCCRLQIVLFNVIIEFITSQRNSGSTAML